ncbi:MAG: hypothetical protein FWD36_00665 [Treponema sp.]|nr:hypothetical protein [Treponema sp.]
MKNIAGILTIAVCIIMMSCSGPFRPESEPRGLLFYQAPGLLIYPDIGGYTYTFTDSTPPADEYFLHYMVSPGPVDNKDVIYEFGWTRLDIERFDMLSIALGEGEFLSAFMTARKDGYQTIYSNIHIVGSDEERTIEEFDTIDHLGNPTLALTVTPVVGGLECTWTHSYPFAVQYDLYYIASNHTSAAVVKTQGVKITSITEDNVPYPYTFTISNLDSSKTYSVVVTARRPKYTAYDSAVLANLKPLQ